MTEYQIGPYPLLSELKPGPHARLFLAVDATHGHDVVLKLLSATEWYDPTIRARYKLEAQLLASLDTPIILACEDFSEQDGHLYIVTRWIPGGSLAESLKFDRLPVEEIGRIFKCLAPVLDAAHNLGILHGDIKPANIIFDENDLPILADFGMVSLLRAQVSPEAHVIIGPPAYISPEQVLAGANALGTNVTGGLVGGQSDIYMLGALLFEMLTGSSPYQAETPLGYAMHHLSSPIPSVRERRPELAAAWDDIIQKAMAKEPEERFASVGELADAVQQAVLLPNSPPASDAVVAAKPTAPIIPSAAVGQAKTLPATWEKEKNALASAPTVLEPAQVQAKKRRGGLAFTLILLFVAIASVTVFFFTQGKLLPQFPVTSVETISMQLETPSMVAFSPTSSLVETKASVAPDVAPASSTPAPSFTATLSPSPLPSPTLPPPTPTQILVTAVPPASYVVQYNDTFFTLASQFHVTMSELLGMNGFTCDSYLAASKPIVIPPAYPYANPPVNTPIALGNFEKLELQQVVDCMTDIHALRFSPDGSKLAVASGQYVYLWNVGDWKPYLRLKGNNSDISSLAFSPNNLVLASGSNDGTVKLWQISDGALVATLRGHSNQVTGVAFHPGGQQLVSTSRDATARLWQIDGTLLYKFSGYSTFGAAFSPDGQTLAIGYADAVRIYRISDLSLVSSLPSADVVSHLVYSPDGQLLASSSDLWHVGEARHIYHFQSSGDTPAFTNDGLALFIGRRTWRISNGKLIGEMESPLPEMLRTNDVWDSLDISLDGGTLAWGTPEGLYIYSLPANASSAANLSSRLHVVEAGDNIYNLSTAYQVRLSEMLAVNGLTCESPIFQGQNLWVPDDAALAVDQSTRQPIGVGNVRGISSLRSFEMSCTLTNSDFYFSDGGAKLISGSTLWDIATGTINIQVTEIPRRFDGSPDPDLYSPLLVFSPDQATLAARVGNDIQIWDIATGHLLRTLSGHQDVVMAMAYSPDGQMLISSSGTGEKKIMFWNPNDGSQVRAPLEGWSVFKLKITSDGEYLIGEVDDAVRVWRLSDNRLLNVLQGIVGEVSYSPDGSSLAFVSCQETTSDICTHELLSLYKVAEGAVPWSVYGYTENIGSIQFSPDGQTIAAAAGNGITIVNASDGRLQHRLYDAGNEADVVNLLYSTDSSLLVSTWADQSIRIWNAADGSLVYTMHNQPIDRIAFSPDDTILAVLSRNVISILGIK